MKHTIALFLFCAATVFAQGTLTISGDVANPAKLTEADLKNMAHERIEVIEESGKVVYEGVLLRDLLVHAGAPSQLRGKSLSTFAIAKASDGYQVIFTLAELDPEFGNERVVVVYNRGGQPLNANQGPLRIMCVSDKAGARSVRMLQSIEVVALQK